MAKRQSKKRTLLSSIISLILCIAMFIGTTFSWFTDNVSNTGNRIETGTLKVKLLRYNGTEYEDISNGVGDIFTTENQENTTQWPLNGTLWEPGKTEVVYLAVANEGKLDLNYNIILNVTNDVNNDVALEKAFTYAIVPGATGYEASAYSDWATILNAAGESNTGAVPVGFTTAAQNGALTDGAIDYFALAVHMSEDAGNEYQDQAIEIDVKVTAKQMASEYDSFSNEYDLNASFIQAEIYVAADGDDANVGTADSPFKTIARAQEEVRKMNSNMWGDIYVYLGEGIYVLEDTLTFGTEDDGSNGFYVRYVANGDVTISGGQQITGWENYSATYSARSVSDVNDNLYVAQVEGFTGAGIGEMYVNDTYARRAESEEIGRVLSVVNQDTSDDSTYPVDGLVVSSDILSGASVTVGRVSDIQIRMVRAWKGMTFNVESITDNDDGTSTLNVHLTAAENATGSLYHGAEADAGFYVVNAFAELDQPGEFYYDETTGNLYYYPREGEDMATAEVYIPVLEEIMKIQGSDNNNKVQNITFENITFTHAAWYRDLESGFYTQQAGVIYTEEGVNESEIIPAAINLYASNGIEFTNNVFKGFHGAGIGLHNGAENTKIIGNVFEDIGDSAITVGEPTLINEDSTNSVNVALDKPVTSYVFADCTVKNYDFILDGVLDGQVWSRASWDAENGFVPGFTKAAFEVDLGGEYSISKIKLENGSNWLTKAAYSIYASDEKLSSISQIEAADKLVYAGDLTSDEANALSTTREYEVSADYSSESYRYLYYVGGNNYSYVRDFAAYDADGDNVASNGTVTSFLLKDYTVSSFNYLTNDATNDGAWDWNTNVEGANYVSGFTKATFQVDLGELCSFNKIQLQTSSSWVTQVTYRIYASAEQLTSTADIEVYADELAYAGARDQSIAQGQIQTYTLDSQYSEKEYRYLYYVHEGTYAYVTRIAAINENVKVVQKTQLPANTTIADNYITRCGIVNVGAPGITAYHTRNLDCSNNELCDLPYTAISLGWGWGRSNSNACGNNTIASNKIHNIMQIANDGGAIYTLGDLKDSEISGNYIYDVPNVFGGIYLDQGSSNVSVYNNVLENVPSCFLVSTADGATGNKVYSNYFSANEGFDAIVSAVYENQVFFNPGDYPLEAIEVIENSGIKAEYQSIKAKDSGRTFALTSEMMQENVMHTDPAIVSDSIYTKYVLRSRTLYTDNFINTVSTDGSVGSYPAELVQAVKDQIAICEGYTSPMDRENLADATDVLVELLVQLSNSRVTDTLDHLLADAKDTLISAEVGTKVGQVFQSSYDELERVIEKAEAVQASGEITLLDRVFLEKSIEKFNNEKIALDIIDFSIPEGMLSVAIDKEEAEINVEVRYFADLSNMEPNVEISNGVLISQTSGSLADGEIKYTVSTLDGTESKEWTVNVVRETVLTGELTLDEKIENAANWITAGNNEKKYSAELFGNSILKFRMTIANKAATDFPGITFRNSVLDKQTSGDGTKYSGNCYTVIFNSNGTIEFHRFNDGNRTKIHETNTDAMKVSNHTGLLKYGEPNDIEITTDNVDTGVSIIVKVNNTIVIEMVDTDTSAVKDPGYLGYFMYASPVIFGAGE